MLKKGIPFILVLVLLVIGSSGCFDNNDSQEEGYTALEIYSELQTDIEDIYQKYNVSLQSIDCYQHTKEGRYEGFNLICYNFDDPNKKPSNVAINIENGKINTILTGNGTPTSFEKPLDITKILIDSDKAYNLARKNIKIESFFNNGDEYGVEILRATLVNNHDQITWQIGFEYQDEDDQPFKTAYIYIDAETGEVVNVWGDGVD